MGIKNKESVIMLPIQTDTYSFIKGLSSMGYERDDLVNIIHLLINSMAVSGFNIHETIEYGMSMFAHVSRVKLSIYNEQLSRTKAENYFSILANCFILNYCKEPFKVIFQEGSPPDTVYSDYIYDNILFDDASICIRKHNGIVVP